MNRWKRLLALIALVAFAGAASIVGDSMDVNDKTIATTVAVDRKEGEVWFYVEIANIEAGKSSSSTGTTGTAAQYVLVKAHGKTFTEARTNLDRQLDKPLYVAGVRMLLLTERFAQEDLVEYLYRLRSDEGYRKKVITIITQDDLDMIYKTINDQNESVGYSGESTIQTLDSTGGCAVRTTSRLLENLSDPYTGILIPCIGLHDKELAFTGYAVVYDTRQVGFIPAAECKGLNMLKAEEAKTFYTVPYHGVDYSIETIVKKIKITADYRDGWAGFKFSLSIEATIDYGSKKTPYSLTKENEKEITALLMQLIQNDVVTAINLAQNVYRTDYLQCDDVFRVKYPVLFESLNWNDVFPKAYMTTDVNVGLLPTQMIDYSVDAAR